MKGIVSLVASASILLACGGGSGGNGGAGEPNVPGGPGGGSDVLERTSNLTCVAPQGEIQAGELSLTPAFPNLPPLNGLVGLFQAPGDDTMWYALLREGRIMRFPNIPQADELEVFLDIRASVRESGEMGLLGLAFHPQFTANGELYIYYSDDDNNGASNISRFRSEGAARVDNSSEELILRLSQPASNHNGGAINFGPDGYLYIGFGDGGGGNDTFRNGQNTMTWHGAVLRIDVDNGSPYSIPADNPFVGNSAYLPEIYAWGIRNPWRWTFDQATGELWLADVGQGETEEVNIVSAGDNLGWPIMEGSQCLGSTNCDQSGLTLPVAEYPNDEGGDCAVTGGYVYRGSEIPALDGDYLFADYCTGRIRRSSLLANDTWQTEEVLVTNRNVASLAQDNDGEVYVLDVSGSAGNSILKFTAEASPVAGEPAEQLSETGCYTSLVDKTVAPGVVPYDIASRLWSDGAEKERFFAIPDDTSISILGSGEFNFPEGTVLIKNFLDGDRYLETRLFIHQDVGWRGYSYEWNEAGTEAMLLEGGKRVTSDNFVHIYPSSDECSVCHTSAANHSLGLEVGQLNNDLLYPSGQVANQIATLFDAGYLASEPTVAQTETFAALDDTAATVGVRARSYLHSNCSSCHRPNASGSLVDLRIQTSLSSTGACDQVPSTGDLGIENARIIAPGDPSRSVLLARMQDLGEARMPPLASDVVDNQAVALIEQWISEMTTCD